MEAFLHGVLLSFGLILPLGIQNLFVLNQGINQPAFVRALPVVATAAICDTVIILAAVHGVSLLIGYAGWLKWALICCGVVFLLYMGWLTWRQTPGKGEFSTELLSVRQQVVFAASVSLLNPHAILDTVGVIGTTALSYAGTAQQWFTAACILVSWCWFFFLAALGRFAKRQSLLNHRAINKMSAVFIWASAAYMLYSLIVG